MPRVADFSLGQDMLSDFFRGRPTHAMSGDEPISSREGQPEGLIIAGGEQTSEIMVAIPRPSTSTWFRDAVEEALNLTRLPNNWDSYGGRSPSLRVAVATAELLGLLAQEDIPRPQIVPTSDGGIQLEWHRQGADLEIVIVSAVRARVWFDDLITGDTLEDEVFADFAPLVGLAAETIR